MQLSYDEIGPRVAEFETQYDTDACMLDDVWIWPLIRTQMTSKRIRLRHTNSVPITSRKPKDLARRILNRITSKAPSKSKETIPVKNWKSADSSQVRIVGLANTIRAVQLPDNTYCDSTVMPLLQKLQGAGAQVECWSWKKDAFPTPTPIDTYEVATSHVIAKQIPEPYWFPPIEAFAKHVLGVRFRWSDIQAMWSAIGDWRTTFDNVLATRRTALLITNCWYGWEQAAARLAAINLKIPTLEVQHGIQSYGHPCFHNWSATSPDGYLSPFPRSLWVWGKKVGDSLSGNAMVANVLVGGNVFLQTSNRSRLEGASTTIGYTLTWPLAPLLDSLVTTIRNCPSDWRWILRLHPAARHELHNLKRAVAGLRAYVAFSPTFQSIPEFMSPLTIHATHESTTALEALFLGLPTLVTTAGGVKAMQPFVDKGVMVDACEPLSFTDKIREALAISPVACRAAVSDIFTSSASSAQCVTKVIQIAEAGGNQ